jgi:hypothetical protein
MIWIIILILSVLCGIASAWTGSGGSKLWRRIFIPGISAVFGVLALWNLWIIAIMARAGAISMGYGMPSKDDPNPSALGQFWYDVFGGELWREGYDPLKKASIFTRGTIGVMKAVSIVPIAIVSGHWILFVLAGSLITGNGILWGAIVPREGSFTLSGRKLLWEEFLIEGIDTFIILGLIIICR